jgi:hypothetical protein
MSNEARALIVTLCFVRPRISALVVFFLEAEPRSLDNPEVSVGVKRFGGQRAAHALGQITPANDATNPI